MDDINLFARHPEDGPVRTLVLPVPENAPEPPARHPQLGRPSQTWAYPDAVGLTLHYVWRFDTPRGKEIRPLTLWRGPDGAFVWDWKAVPEKRPLYGLDRLAASSDAPVLVVEGEKAADAARELCADMVVITSSGGAHAARHADWSPLRGRAVRIWPDNDDAGRSYAAAVAELLSAHGCMSISIIDSGRLAGVTPDGELREAPAGWDAADAQADGWSPEVLEPLLTSFASPWLVAESASADPLDSITSDLTLKAVLRQMTYLKPGDYALQRKATAKELGLSVAALDRFVRQGRGDDVEPADRAQRDILLELAQGSELWRDPAGDAYATVEEGGARKTFRVRGGDFRSWLIRRWMEHFSDGGLGSAPGSQGLQDAIAAVEAKAQQGETHTAFVRIGHAEERVYVDLGDESWRAVEIDATGWRVVSEVPVRFTRPSGLLPLPEPQRGAHALEALLSILPESAADDADAKDASMLLRSYLVGIFLPQGSLPLLALSGRQGSGKSTLTRRLRALVDPNQAPARQQPRGEDDLIIAARNGALVAFDNLSRISPELSDALCRLATGAGFSKRRLYTDSDEVIVQVRRPVIVNGITDLVRMPDLADRCLFVELPTRSTFAPEAELEAAFERDRPAILGLLYDAVSAALKGYASEVGTSGVRLADFERWVRATAVELGMSSEEVSRVLSQNRTRGDWLLIEDDIVASLIVKILGPCSSLSGTASEILRSLREHVEKGDEGHLPKGPKALSAHLKRFEPTFERCGFIVTHGRHGRDRRRTWTITRRI